MMTLAELKPAIACIIVGLALALLVVLLSAAPEDTHEAAHDGRGTLGLVLDPEDSTAHAARMWGLIVGESWTTHEHGQSGP